jgi:hypothetical protein
MDSGNRASPTDSEPARIEQNIQDSDATIWFGRTTNSSVRATAAACLTFGKPYMPVYPGAAFEPSHVTTRLGGLMWHGHLAREFSDTGWKPVPLGGRNPPRRLRRCAAGTNVLGGNGGQSLSS